MAARSVPPRRGSIAPGRQGRRALTAGGKYLVLLIALVVFTGPFLWLFSTALKTQGELTALPVRFLPTRLHWENFTAALTSVDFVSAARNSLFLATIHSVLVTLSSALVGFGFARLRGKGKRFLFIVMLSTLMVPPIVTLLPTFILFSRIGLIDTYWPWVLWGLGSSPYLVFLFRQFFAAIPTEIEEAAILDGSSYFGIFWRIFLPLSFPVITTAIVLSFTQVWGDYVAQALFLGQDTTTLSVILTFGYLDPHSDPLLNVQAAGAVLYVLPVLIVFFFAQRYFVRGIVTTGLKG